MWFSQSDTWLLLTKHTRKEDKLDKAKQLKPAKLKLGHFVGNDQTIFAQFPMQALCCLIAKTYDLSKSIQNICCL